MINVVKIGGNIIDNPEALKAFLSDFVAMPGKKILVHGGGKEATRMSESMGVKTNMIDGRRVTDQQTLDIVTMVYAGLINKRIVSLLQSLNCNAIGLTGADGNAIPASRRPAKPIDYGFVGDIDPSRVNTVMLATLLDAGMVPVFCAICHDGAGILLNCNADSVASAVARGAASVAPTRLTFCFDKPGVMTDINDESSVIPLVTAESFASLKKTGIIAAGMIPKLQSALVSAEQGVTEVRICKAEALNTSEGTIIRMA
ncbi:MAG: acetylglutamate kinase [Bacteroides sp.]|nr:acetylglutamate kinase [Bacteroides sp.]MBD5357274.1 acetylglutamate kinase [Bacteroides sp.]